MKPVGIGVIGCGFVGRGAHVPAFAELENARLAAIADPDATRRNKVVAKYGVSAAYADYAELIKDPEVQAVVVSVPTTLHVPVSLAAIRAGKHVLCEMPLAPSLAEADELAAEAEKQGVLLMPGLNFRYTPNYVKAKELIDSGELGKVCAVLYREFIPAKDLARQWPADSWVWNLKESGGPLFTLSVWSIDLLRWLLGTEVAELNAATKYTVLEQFGGTLGYDSCVSLKLASGVVGCLQYSGSVSDPAASSALEVIGDNNRLLNASGNDTVEVLGQDPAKIQWNVKAPGAKMWGHYQQNQHFAQCIQEGRTPDITLQDGRKAMELALQIATS